MSIVIPVYNNREGLITSLLSISQAKRLVPKWHFKTIVVNDGSTKDSYEDISTLFEEFLDITLLDLSENRGPGYARQIGLDLCSTKYVLFLDAGDVISFASHFITVMRIVEQNPHIAIFSCGREHYIDAQKYTYEKPNSEILHGKIYQLEFLRKYHIEFIKEHEYYEDMGFNIICRIICSMLKKYSHENVVLDINMPITIELYDANSITRKNNGEFFYTSCCGYSVNVIHAINNALSNNVPLSVIEQELYICLTWQYLFFVEPYEKNICLEQNLEASLNLYKYYKQLFPTFNKDLLRKAYREVTLSFKDAPGLYFKEGVPELSIWDFINLLEEGIKK